MSSFASPARPARRQALALAPVALLGALAAIGASARSAPAYAQAPEPPGEEHAAEEPEAEDNSGYGAAAQVDPEPPDLGASLARSLVTRRELEERLPSSAPDALRYSPGVYVQQTAHGQASPYVRALTGQQVVHLFDGVRLNNGIYRQGPNQYFFTVDTLTIQRLEVLRGSASVQYGSDALGGAILAYPLESFLDPDNRGLRLRPRIYGIFTSMDMGGGGRAEALAQIGPDNALRVGAGYRRLDRLEASGVVANEGRMPPFVPRFEEDGRTMLGTGFQEATFDLRFEHAVNPELRLIAAAYGYLQLDSPRTDQCPPPEAPEDECLRVAHQLRALSYLGLRGHLSPELRNVEILLSYQRHEEEQVRDRPRSFVQNAFRNEVDTVGLSLRAESPRLSLGELGGQPAFVTLRYGAQAYHDEVGSSGSQTFTDLGRRFSLSRGQYLDGSDYTNLGAFLEIQVDYAEWLTVRSGARLAFVGAQAEGDPESGSSSVDRGWGAAVGRIGAELRPTRELAIRLNVDEGFRAPNLDDLTSRQQVGPGFQFENADLHPERTATFELGVGLDVGFLKLDVWGFATLLEDGIVRAVRAPGDCPPETPACVTSRNLFQLINAEGTSYLFGTEGGATAYLPLGFTLRATYSYAWGEGPNTRGGSFFDERVPLSRVPPLNGTVELLYRHDTGFYAGAALRWALAQDRLAPVDLGDPRIPVGGTPGYGVVDLRMGLRLDTRLRLSLVFENILDTPYRLHGSSINGPGRGVRIAASVGL